jgi:hypothetical protein
MNRDGIAFSVEIAPRIEVVLIDRPSPVETIWSQHEVNRFEDRGFAAIVVAEQQGVRRNSQFGFCNAAKIFNG